MRVVIVGAGKVGYTLAKYLANEDHDVVVIEEDEGRRSNVQNTLDVMTIPGNGASPKVLMNPDVRSADLMIAVTDSDEVNMVACMAAKQAGIKQTIARVRNIEYIGKAETEFHRLLGIDLTINPEHATAVEISRILMIPAAMEVEDFAGGKVRMLEVKMPKDSPLLDKPLAKLKLPPKVLIVGIIRRSIMIIPGGADELKAYDNVIFIGEPAALKQIEGDYTETFTKIQRVLIIGAGRIGRHLALRLEQSGISVKMIDKDPERCQHMAGLLRKGSVFCGDGTDVDLLNQEGISEADAVICLTSDDKLNLLLALLAKELGSKKTVVRVGRTEYIPLLEKVGVDVIVSPRLITAGVILSQVRRGKFVAISLLEGAKAQAMEVIVSQETTIKNRKLKDVGFPRDCIVGAVVRDGDVFIPNGQSILQDGDRAIIFALSTAISKVEDIF
ncbi:MAG: Trk system potassium transporter TrkA [Desulfitobacteriia bacterium]